MGRRVNPNASKRIPWSSDKAQALEAPGTMEGQSEVEGF